MGKTPDISRTLRASAFAWRRFGFGILVFGFVSDFVLRNSCSAGTVELFAGEKFTGVVVLESTITVLPPGTTRVPPPKAPPPPGSPPAPKEVPGQKFDFSQILRATFTDGPMPDGTIQPGVVLRSGARVAGPFGTINEPLVPVGRRELKVPGPEIAWLVYDPIPAADVDKVPTGKIGAILPGGDFFEGRLRGIDGPTVKMISPVFGPRNFAPVRHDLRALVLRDLRPAPIAYEVRLSDGSILHAESLTVEKEDLVLHGGFLDGGKIETKDVAEIRAGPARYQPLATVKPLRVDPPLGITAEAAFGADQTLSGGAFTLPDRMIQHYLDTMVGCTAMWAVPPGMTLFNAIVVVSPKVPPNNRLVFSVYADGRPVFRSTPMTAADPPLAIRTTFGPARALSLRVEAHFPANATGDGVWIEPTMLRK